MANVKVGSTTYTGVSRTDMINAGTNASVYFMESDAFMSIMAGGTGGDYYENPYVAQIGSWACGHFLKFTKVYLPNVTTCIQNGARFMGAETIILPKLTDTTNQLFNNSVTKVIDLGALTAIGNYGFSGSKIEKIILRGNTVPTVGNVNNQHGSVAVYVPTAMLSSYQADTSWASLVSSKSWTLNALEGSAYEDPDWFKS